MSLTSFLTSLHFDHLFLLYWPHSSDMPGKLSSVYWLFPRTGMLFPYMPLCLTPSHHSSACLHVTCSVISNITTLFKLQTISNLYISFKNHHFPQPASHYLFPKNLPPFIYNPLLILFIVHSLPMTVQM